MLENVQRSPAHDPDSRYQTAGDIVPLKRHKLDSEENLALLRTLQAWRTEGRDIASDNRLEQYIDCDFYDGYQYSDADRITMEERFQAPLVFNLVGPAIDWIIGTERRTRVDYTVHPRSSEDQDAAKLKKELLKYISDANGTGWERSRAFEDAVKCGIGWTEQFIRGDAAEEPIGERYVDWKEVTWDPFSRSDDMSDARWITRERKLDLDFGLAMWPDRAEALRGAAVSTFDGDTEDAQDAIDLPATFTTSPFTSQSRVHALFGTSGRSEHHSRLRVRICMTWFRRPQLQRKIRAKIAEYDQWDGKLFDPNDPQMLRAYELGNLSLSDTVTDTIWYAAWIPGNMGTLLELAQSPYKHNRFPFTPIWCFRRHRDGMPYGIIRRLRDPQEDFNKRRSKALFAMSVNRLLYEEDAIHEEDEDDVLDQASRPNAQMRFRSGALSQNKVRVEDQVDVGVGHLRLMEDARQQVYEGSGVTRENLGQDTNSTSGRAILAKQQQGATVTAKLFDNYRYAIMQAGKKTLSLVEQFMTQPKQFRILGEERDLQFVAINEPDIDPATGEVFFRNDITRANADFVVDQQDYRETIRQALAEQLLDTIGKLPPEIGVQLLDLAVDLMDIPNKDEIVRRIRQVTGQTPQAPDPEAEAARLAEQQAQQEAQRLAMEEQRAKIRKLNADAGKSETDAKAKSVDGKVKALDAAGIVASAIQLAPAADRLWNAPMQPEGSPQQ